MLHHPAPTHDTSAACEVNRRRRAARHVLRSSFGDYAWDVNERTLVHRKIGICSSFLTYLLDSTVHAAARFVVKTHRRREPVKGAP